MFYANYESETINVTAERDEWTLLDYPAPEADPFPHHLIIVVDTSMVVEISETLDGATNIIFTDDGSGKFTVESGETLHVVLRNPNGAVGIVHTTLYCDSWNYAAYILVGAGTLMFIYWYLRSGGEDIEDL